MAQIKGSIRIARPVTEVFDFLADSRNEPTYNPDMRRVTLLTSEPVGEGSVFRAVMGRAEMSMIVTLLGHDRPNRLTSQITSPMMDVVGTLISTPDPAEPASAMLLAWDWQVRPKGWLRLLGPAFGLIGARTERRIWTGAKAALEARALMPSGSSIPLRPAPTPSGM